MLAIGNNELGEELKDTAHCPVCGENCEIKYGERTLPDGTKEPSKLLSYVKCCDKLYLVGVDGRSINNSVNEEMNNVNN